MGITGVLLALALSAVLLVVPAGSHDSDAAVINEGGLIYSVSGDTVFADQSLYGGEITIPSTVTHDGKTYSVTGLDLGGFQYCESLRIPSTVTNIRTYNLDRTSSLREVQVSADNSSFASLDGVLFSKDMSVLIYYPMGRVADVYNVPDGVVTVDEYSFYGDGGPRSVIMSDSVTSIESECFYENSTLERIDLGRAEITSLTLYGCSNLSEIEVSSDSPYTVYDGVLFFGESLYRYPAASAPTEYVTPTQVGGTEVTEVYNYAFMYAENLRSVTLSEGIRYLETGAFTGCPSLEEVAFPSSLISMGQYVFEECPSLVSADLSGTELSTASTGVFQDCASLESVYLPDSLRDLDMYMFDGCSSLKVVDMPGARFVREYSFLGCTSLESIELPSVTSISRAAFSGCTALVSVSLGPSASSLEPTSFYGCISLSDIAIDDGCTHLKIVDGIVYSINDNGDPVGLILCVPAAIGSEITVPDGVTSIESGAFSNLTGLRSITIPGDAEVAQGAFDGCTSLETISTTAGNRSVAIDDVLYSCDAEGKPSTLIVYPAQKKDASFLVPDTVTAIGGKAFRGNAHLTELTIGEGVLTIGDYAFNGCTALSTVRIPSTVNDIGSWVFDGCTSLSSITVADGNPDYHSDAGVLYSSGSSASLIKYPAAKTDSVYTLPADITFIYDLAFEGASNLMEFRVEDGNDNFAAENGAIMKTEASGLEGVPQLIAVPSGLESFTVPQATVSISGSAFTGNIVDVVLPDLPVRVYGDAFHNCDGLRSITVQHPGTTFREGAISFDDESMHTIDIVSDSGYRMPDDAVNGNVTFTYTDSSSGGPPTGGFPWMWLVAGIVALLAVVGIVFYLKRRSH